MSGMRVLRWLQLGAVYQIYPRSFQDSDGDGVGDLPGITGRLDYLSWLGIDAIWLSPIFPSPMADFGYDVADYCDVDPLFGSRADLDALIEAVHGRGMKLILDFVPNHTSDQHPWFREARASRRNAKRDWYIWRDPAPDGGPPNNWQSQAGGSAWAYDAPSGQYYYHAFLEAQPDLNWRNPAVRAAMHDVLRFWLERGVDGFRVDVLWHLMKDPAFRDDPLNPDFREGDPPFRRVIPVHSVDHEDIHEVVTGIRRLMESYGDRVLIGEIYLPIERLMAYYGHDLQGAHLPFNFQLIGAPWHAATLADLIDSYERALPRGGWGNWVLGNHDQKRVASRLGQAQARVAAMLLLSLRGTPTIYYGDELGFEDVPIPPGRERDPFGLRMPGTGQGRDPQRAPMLWDTGLQAGFTTGEPWLPLAADAAARNVATMRQDQGSILNLTRELLHLRRRRPALHAGAHIPLAAQNGVLLYERRLGPERILVALNLTAEPRSIRLTEPLDGRVLLSTCRDREGNPARQQIDLRADEGVLVDVTT